MSDIFGPGWGALGAGYHANQSVIAIGSGMLTGKGWGEGTQNQLSFLPEQHTDFIFSVWAEEQGFVGAVILLALFVLFLLLAADVIANARDHHGAYLAMGVAAMIFWHVFVNIGMVTGVLPVVGVTLPFMSYGGSSLVLASSPTAWAWVSCSTCGWAGSCFSRASCWRSRDRLLGDRMNLVSHERCRRHLPSVCLFAEPSQR